MEEINARISSLSSPAVASEIAEFPLPADATDEERATAKREIGKHARIVGEEPRVIRFEGTKIGQTGPVWHLQYTRLYKIAKGYLVAAHDLHEGIKVFHSERPEALPRAFDNEMVREFIEDELRYRKILSPEGEAASARSGHE